MFLAFTFDRTARRLIVALGATLALSCAAQTGTEPAHPIKDPHYGDALFQFYQDRYFTSLTNLMVSQHFGRVEHHADEAEILRGGIMLSYGLLREAHDIFARLVAANATPATRDRAYFYLAKINYQRGYLPAAEEAIGHIGTALPAALEEDRALLHANILMARANYAGAASVLGAMGGKSGAVPYARFNLGVALAQSGGRARGIAMLDELGRAPAIDEEMRNLRDRANVALGFVALAEKRPHDARIVLERVRLNGMESNKALLGLGWAAAAQEQTEVALVPWRELGARDISDSAVLEAQIAIPYAYAELGAYGQSMESYNLALAAFERENLALGESIASIRSGKLVDALLASNPGEEMGWFWRMRTIPVMPHANHLAQVMAGHAFQEAYKNYRDLRFLVNNLEQWQDKLSVFEDMLATRRKRFAERLPQVLDQASAQASRTGELRQRRTALTAQLASAQNDADGVAFANAKERDLMARVARVQASVTDKAGPDDSAAQRARLAAGVLTWQLAQDYPGRVWQAKKDAQAVTDELAKASLLDSALSLAQREEPARFDAFSKRIAAIAPLLQVMLPRLVALGDEQRRSLQEIVIADLTVQQERLAGYATQARFAVAQLYDRGADGSTERRPATQEADHAHKP